MKQNLWAHDVLVETGHQYSSSVYPIAHDHYGIPDAPRFAYRPRPELLEIPATSIRLLSRNFPASGGGFFRLLPYPVSRWGLARVNSADGQSGVFYMHPWEIDDAQPRMPGIGAKTRFRHYVNLDKTFARLSRLLEDFAWDRMDRVFAQAIARR
jgi:polysaccharide deacetylase family protein (PEP-CTERM system associated)